MDSITLHENIIPYLNEIADRLWSGHAAVMIGAGFSKNARPNGALCPRFPDWPQLGDLFYERIHGRKPDDQKYLSALKLADEVQAALGRPVLDQLLRSAIPDKDYEPSPLHVKLLELPWSDVFTTNFDTLLERARFPLTSRKYDVVLKKEDLVYSERPRIIKLHGSFPCEQPFIITEDDYRRYPKDFAPFVNTVQQALLENTLCLVGFSGDDPNFLQWIGWIRDNLGNQNSPKIYLVGIINLSDAQKKLLEKRNIVLVDLNECSGVDGNHYRALDKFIDYLSSRKTKDNLLAWPERDSLRHPDFNNSDKKAQLTSILTEWKQVRLSYPGWCILPEDRRSHLWTFTQYWIDFITNNDVLTVPLNIELAYELTWRVEKCLCPMMNNHIQYIESILRNYNPFPEEQQSEDVLKVTPLNPKWEMLDWKGIRQICIALYLWLLRCYREEGLLQEWKTADGKLEKIRKYLSPNQEASLHYERALYALFALDLPKLKTQLTAWPSNESLPFWEAKRAGLFAEIGQVEDAEKILEQSLKNTRSKLNLKPVTTDYSLVSQEALMMLLLQYISTAIDFTKGHWTGNKEHRRQFTERWNALKQYKCDPWNELRIFESCLERKSIENKEFVEERGFDIGRVTRTIHLGSGADEDAIVAFQFLRFCEEAGIPYRIPGSTLGKESAAGALARISRYSPYWALATMMRVGDDKIVDRIFNRESLQKLNVSSVDKLIEGYLEALARSQTEIKSGNPFCSNNLGIVLAQVVPEILSRLCCKCSTDAKNKLLEFLLDVYKSEIRSKYRGIRNLTQRLLFSFSHCQRFQLIPRFLEFPVLGNLDPLTMRDFLNPFHFISIDKSLTLNFDKPKIQGDHVRSLLNKARSNAPGTRKWATFTLSQLYHFDLLGNNWTSKFAAALWSQIDTLGFPDNTEFYKFAFLALPHPNNVDPISLFKSYIKTTPICIQKGSTSPGVSITGGEVPFCDELVGSIKFLHWTEEEIIAILGHLIEWWDADKVYLERDGKSSRFDSIKNEFRARFSKLVNVLVEVIAPSLNANTKVYIKDELWRLLTELRGHRLPALRAEAACIHIYPTGIHNLTYRIKVSLSSSSSELATDALHAIMIFQKADSPVSEFDSSLLLSEIAQMIRWRRKTGLSSALNILARFIAQQPSFFDVDIFELVLIGLQHIADETSWTGDFTDPEFPEKLEIREAAAFLAFSLFKFYRNLGMPIPDAVRTWDIICHSEDEFAEIRNNWLQEDCQS